MPQYRIQNITAEYQTIGDPTDTKRSVAFDPNEIVVVDARIWENLSADQKLNFTLLDTVDETTLEGDVTVDVGDLETVMQNVLLAVDQLEGFTDGLEALATTLNSKDFSTQTTLAAAKTTLDGILAAVDGLEGFTDGLEALHTTLNGHVDGLEGLLTTQNTFVDGLESSLTTLNAKDFATQTTLAAAKTVLDNLLLATDGLESALTTLNGKDFATQATLVQIYSAVDTLEAGIATANGHLSNIHVAVGAAAAILADIETAIGLTNDILGTDGAAPPVIPGTGVRGWLRSIYERLTGTLDVQITNEVEIKNDSGVPLPVQLTNSGGSTIQYTEGDVDATMTGIMTMYEGAGDTATIVNEDDRLPVMPKPPILTNVGGAILNQTVTNVAVFTPTIPVGAKYALVHNEGPNDLRWRDDGVAPTTTVGFPLLAGTDRLLTDLTGLAFTAEAGVSNKLNINFYA